MIRYIIGGLIDDGYGQQYISYQYKCAEDGKAHIKDRVVGIRVIFQLTFESLEKEYYGCKDKKIDQHT